MSPGRKRVEMRIVTHSQQLSQLTRGPHAGLPGRVQVAINALYALMNRCKVEAEGRSGEGAGRWRRRCAKLDVDVRTEFSFLQLLGDC